MPYALVGGKKVFFAHHAEADATAPPLILVHGAGGSHQFWGQAVRHIGLASTYALDLPGHGRSGTSGHRTVADYASSVAAFMDSLRLEQAVVAGHSMGGAIALHLALEFPQRVAGLVLVGTGGRLRVLPAILWGTLTNFDDTIKLICERAYSPSTPSRLVRLGCRQMLRVPPQTIHDDFAACDAFDVMGRLGEIRCPALVICGTGDALTPPKYSRFLAEHVAGAELSWIDGAGHMVMIEKPQLVAEAIEAALARWNL